MTPVRPTITPVGPAPAQRPDAARQAFFQAALGKPAAAAKAALQAAPPEPVATPVRAQRLPDAGAEPPARILRPGSLLDIRV